MCMLTLKQKQQALFAFLGSRIILLFCIQPVYVFLQRQEKGKYEDIWQSLEVLLDKKRFITEDIFFVTNFSDIPVFENEEKSSHLIDFFDVVQRKVLNVEDEQNFWAAEDFLSLVMILNFKDKVVNLQCESDKMEDFTAKIEEVFKLFDGKSIPIDVEKSLTTQLDENNLKRTVELYLIGMSEGFAELDLPQTSLSLEIEIDKDISSPKSVMGNNSYVQNIRKLEDVKRFTSAINDNEREIVRFGKVLGLNLGEGIIRISRKQHQHQTKIFNLVSHKPGSLSSTESRYLVDFIDRLPNEFFPVLTEKSSAKTARRVRI